MISDVLGLIIQQFEKIVHIHTVVLFNYIFCILCAQKSVKGFLFAKLYFEAKEYDLAKR